jgi:hypothetical protein
MLTLHIRTISMHVTKDTEQEHNKCLRSIHENINTSEFSRTNMAYSVLCADTKQSTWYNERQPNSKPIHDTYGNLVLKDQIEIKLIKDKRASHTHCVHTSEGEMNYISAVNLTF